jgi:hypothetical protein
MVTPPPQFIREKAFDSRIQSISKTYRRMDELDRAIEWALQRNPKRFYNISDDFYLWKMDHIIPEIPQLRILYRYDEGCNSIYLIAVDIVQS